MWGSAIRLDLRARLFLTSLVLLVLCGGASAVWLESQMRHNAESELQTRLAEQASLLALTLADRTGPAVDAAADMAQDATGTRFTVILRDGSVVGDSELGVSQLASLDNHADRPEVMMALAEGRGVSQRFSDTLRMDMLYVAVAWPQDDPIGVVRASVPMTARAAEIYLLRTRMGLAGLVGLAIAILMSGLASHWVSRDLRGLLQQAQQLTEPGAIRRLSLPARVDGELSGLVGSINQLSEELERTLADLASERHRFGAVLEGMADAVIAVDHERRISLVNPSAIGLFRPQNSPLGQPLVTLIRSSQVHDAVEAAIRGEDGAVNFELNTEPPRQLQVTLTTQQRGLGCVLICRDVTALRRLERMRRDFITNVSHELRTPVTIIRANAETLLDGAITDQTYGPIFTTAILRNAERLERLIDGLLNLSSLESGRHRISPGVVRLSRVVGQVFGIHQAQAAEKSLQLKQSIPDAHQVLVDPQALEQILTNLVGNALKYCPSGSTIEVRTRMADADSRIHLEVADDGPGIASHHLPRVFERFYRVDAGRAKRMGGSGLGLSIAKHLAEAMDCRIGVHSEPPNGTTFWLELPEASAWLSEE